MSDIDKELMQEFVLECKEMLDLVEPEMLSATEINQDLANKIFRPLHSMKGVAGSFDCHVMASLAHSAETFLSLFRDQGHSSSDPEHLKIFLATFDLLREILSKLDAGGLDNEFSEAAKKIMQTFEQLTAKIIALEFGQIVDVPVAASEAKELAHLEMLETAFFAQEPKSERSKDMSKKVEQNVDDIPDTIEISDEMLDGFISESVEALTSVEADLISMQKGKLDPDLIHQAFRSIHSFKGNCGIFSLSDFEKIGHKMESILSAISDLKILPKHSIFETLIQINDVLKNGIENLRSNPKGLIAGVDAYLDLLATILPDTSNQSEQKITASKKSTQPESPEGQLVFSGPIDLPSETKKVETSESQDKKKKAVSDIRVTTEKLDRLNDLIGELVTAQTILQENFKQLTVDESEKLDKSFHFLSKTINDLQDVSVQIRMIPIEGVFRKMIRISHDISAKAQKQINLTFFGGETEVDKTLIEKISDPLTHMVRNAIDHGIENYDDRLRLGKSEKGVVTLGAKHEAGEVWIYVTDDGRGLDRSKLLTKAVAQGIIEGDGSELSDQEVYKLIFHPGFSTADKITDISGRGVGMDVVLQNVLALKGNVSIETTLGKGTTFIIKIPLTLAILDGMLTRVGDVKYTIPIANVQEIVKISKDNISTLFEDQELVKIRGELLPVVFLNKLHNLHQKDISTLEGILIVLNSNDKTIALLVDELIGQHQTVVKPISSFFSDIHGVSSCTILGNGEVSLILDVTSIVMMATQ